MAKKKPNPMEPGSHYNLTVLGAGRVRWLGFPDSRYSFEGDMLVWERVILDENNKEKTVKTYKKPVEIIADFDVVASEVYGVEGDIEKAVVKKFGGPLQEFIWADKVIGGGEVLLPSTYSHVFQATGDRLNPTISEIGTNPAEENYYVIEGDKTRVFVRGFSGVGGAAGASPNLIAHYRMNDNLATDVILDETGTHNGAVKDATGTVTSAFHSVAGKLNLAQEFDGIDDYIEITDHADFTPALTPFSISSWINADNFTAFEVASKGSTAEWRLVVAGNLVYFDCYDSSEAGRIRRISSSIASYLNQWIHLVATYDGGTVSSGLKIYLNGERIDTSSSPSGTFIAIENLANDVWIGRYSTNYANGTIDNVYFFSAELTADEVKLLYNNGHGTEIPAEVDDQRSFLQRNNSPLGLRSRYEK